MLSSRIEAKFQECRPFRLYLNAINAESTRELYCYHLDKFMIWAKIPDYEILASIETNSIQELLENWTMLQRKNKPNIRRSTVKCRIQPIELFLEINKVLFYKKPLHMLFPKDVEKSGNELPYSNDDIRKMYDSTNMLRTKALILFFSSVGGRPAVLTDPVLKFKHVYSMPYGCKAVLLYAGSKEEYWGFLTPEVCKALDEYRDYRINKGEIITKESFVFLGRGYGMRFDPKHPLPLSLDGAHHILRKAVKGIERIKTGDRFDKGIFLGFRKRFNTILKLDSEVNSNIAEKLMAHKNGLDGVYFKPTREECFREFLKAVPKLTLNEVSKLRNEVEDLEGSRDKLIHNYEERLKNTEKLILELKNRLDFN